MPIDSATFFRGGTRAARTGASVAAANVVDAIPGQTIRTDVAGATIEIFAGSRAATRAARAFVVGILVGGNGTTLAVVSLALFRGRACLARAGAGRVATYAVGAIAGCALGILKTRAAIGET